jgi:indole-3-acetate monooxygenase
LAAAPLLTEGAACCALGDVQAARQHLLFSHHHLAELGKFVAGLDVPYPPYVM